MYSLHIVLGQLLTCFPMGLASGACLGSLWWGIQDTWPNQRNWDLSSRRRSGSTFHALRISQLRILSRRVTLKRVRPGCVSYTFSVGLILEPRERWFQTNRPKSALTSMCMEVTYMCRLLGLLLSPCFGRLRLHVAVALA